MRKNQPSTAADKEMRRYIVKSGREFRRRLIKSTTPHRAAMQDMSESKAADYARDLVVGAVVAYGIWLEAGRVAGIDYALIKGKDVLRFDTPRDQITVVPFASREQAEAAREQFGDKTPPAIPFQPRKAQMAAEILFLDPDDMEPAMAALKEEGFKVQFLDGRFDECGPTVWILAWIVFEEREESEFFHHVQAIVEPLGGSGFMTGVVTDDQLQEWLAYKTPIDGVYEEPASKPS